MKIRKLDNFISGFEQFAQTYNTTPLFAKAGALWLLGTVCLRQVAMKSRGQPIHPNIYAMMVGGPGTGKSQAVNAIRRVLLPTLKSSLIPASITRAGMEDYMIDNQHLRYTTEGKKELSNECIGLSEEMQGILPDQDLGHLTLYNLLYDPQDSHEARTRSNGKMELRYPFCSIYTGAQPAFLATTMPEGAWGMGFMSRTIMIFDVPRERKSIFEHEEVDLTLLADLIHDLKQVHSLHGWMTWDTAARKLYEEWWVVNGGIPVPQAKRLAMGYNSRREVHFLKLSMCMALARSNDMIVTVEDVREAITFMLTLEDRMRHIFAEMANSGSMVALNDVLDQIRNASLEGGYVEESAIIQMLMQRFPATQIHSLIDNLEASGAIKIAKNTGKADINARGFRKFVAGDKVGIL